MANERREFTAAEIADALAKTPRAIRERLASIAPSGEFSVRGQIAKLYAVAALPFTLRDELEKACAQRGYRTIEAMLGGMKPAAVIPGPGAVHSLDRADASAKRDVLAPLLTRHVAGKLTIRATAKLARPYLRNRMGELPSLRTIELWLNTALQRDARLNHFERVELYLPKAPRPASLDVSNCKADPLLFPLAEEILATWSAQTNGLPSAHKALWHLLFLDYECAVQNGARPDAIRTAACERLCAPGSPCYTRQPASVAKQFGRKLEEWRTGGRQPDAFADRRKSNPGRAEKFALTRDETLALRNLVLKKDSVTLAIEWFPRTAACSARTREQINAELERASRLRRLPQWPPSLRRAAHVTEEERALFRGAKAFQNIEHRDRRGLFYLAENGERIATGPNTIWESDDMSINEPFRFSDPETGEVRVGRQTLCTIDVHSAFWIAAQPVGRARDAYRVEDIADHMRSCVEAHGLPTIWRLERGVWENNFIDGIAIAGQSERWGGLTALFHIERTFKSRGKGTVENGFNLLQSILSHESTSIGRHRGEFERGTKLFLAAGRGDERAAGHFWDIAAAADGMAEAMADFNTRPKQRRAHGRELVVPADLYQSAVKRELPESERWRFSPVKREATVRGGFIEVSVPHYPLPFRFTANGVCDEIFFERGYKVLIAFHPGRPEEGCHVFNAELGTRNRDGREFGELLFVAPMADDAPQLNLGKDERAFVARKNANAAVRTEFRGITKAGKPTILRAEARDGYGSRVEAGTRTPAATPRLPGARRAADRGKGDDLIAAAYGHRPEPVEDYEADLRELEILERKSGLIRCDE